MKCIFCPARKGFLQLCPPKCLLGLGWTISLTPESDFPQFFIIIEDNGYYNVAKFKIIPGDFYRRYAYKKWNILIV